MEEPPQPRWTHIGHVNRQRVNAGKRQQKLARRAVSKRKPLRVHDKKMRIYSFVGMERELVGLGIAAKAMAQRFNADDSDHSGSTNFAVSWPRSTTYPCIRAPAAPESVRGFHRTSMA